MWCPRHPDRPLIRIDLPNGKWIARCPGCVDDKRAVIKVVQPEKAAPG